MLSKNKNSGSLGKKATKRNIVIGVIIVVLLLVLGLKIGGYGVTGNAVNVDYEDEFENLVGEGDCKEVCDEYGYCKYVCGDDIDPIVDNDKYLCLNECSFAYDYGECAITCEGLDDSIGGKGPSFDESFAAFDFVDVVFDWVTSLFTSDAAWATWGMACGSNGDCISDTCTDGLCVGVDYDCYTDDFNMFEENNGTYCEDLGIVGACENGWCNTCTPLGCTVDQICIFDENADPFCEDDGNIDYDCGGFGCEVECSSDPECAALYDDFPACNTDQDPAYCVECMNSGHCDAGEKCVRTGQDIVDKNGGYCEDACTYDTECTDPNLPHCNSVVLGGVVTPNSGVCSVCRDDGSFIVGNVDSGCAGVTGDGYDWDEDGFPDTVSYVRCTDYFYPYGECVECIPGDLSSTCSVGQKCSDNELGSPNICVPICVTDDDCDLWEPYCVPDLVNVGEKMCSKTRDCDSSLSNGGCFDGDFCYKGDGEPGQCKSIVYTCEGGRSCPTGFQCRSDFPSGSLPTSKCGTGVDECLPINVLDSSFEICSDSNPCDPGKICNGLFCLPPLSASCNEPSDCPQGTTCDPTDGCVTDTTVVAGSTC